MAKLRKVKESVKIVTPVGRLVFPYLSEPDEGRQYSDGKYKTDLCITKDVWAKEGKELKEAVLRVAREFYGKPAIKLSEFKHPFKDGDEKEQEYYHGCIYITCRGKFEPAVVGPDKTVFAKDRVRQIKGGDYARLVVSVFPYEQSGGGVTLGLDVVQFSHEGEALSGGRAAAVNMLDDLDVELADISAEDDRKQAAADDDDDIMF